MVVCGYRPDGLKHNNGLITAETVSTMSREMNILPKFWMSEKQSK